MNNHEKILEVVLNNSLKIIPLRSVINGKCSCGDKNCNSIGKHPLFSKSWKLLSSDDRKKIEGWIKKYKEINFGVPTGCLSQTSGKYLTVIDVDEKEHEILNSLPETFCYKTGGDGYHFWYWSSKPIKNSVSLLAKKVDVRGSGGYVVIPPSKHESGKNYELLPNSVMTISDLPDSIAKLIESGSKKIKIKIKSGNNANCQKNIISQTAKNWGNYKVPEIRDLILTGSRIPKGVRNITIFRLACSDRAKGVAFKAELLSNVRKYRSFCENREEISEDELETIVSSALKYPAYNNSYQKVNETYLKWLKYRSPEKRNKISEKNLIELDDIFFNSLKPTAPDASCDRDEERSDAGVALQQISQAREQFFKLNGQAQFSNYKPSFLGTKLRSMGFSRKRTSKSNFWNVSLSQLEALIANKKEDKHVGI